MCAAAWPAPPAVGSGVISFRISFRWEKAAAGYFVSFQVSFRLGARDVTKRKESFGWLLKRNPVPDIIAITLCLLFIKVTQAHHGVVAWKAKDGSKDYQVQRQQAHQAQEKHLD